MVQKFAGRSVTNLFALVSLLLILRCNAYNADNSLVDYNDYIKITSTTDPDTVVEEMELYSFPYID